MPDRSSQSRREKCGRHRWREGYRRGHGRMLEQAGARVVVFDIEPADDFDVRDAGLQRSRLRRRLGRCDERVCCDRRVLAASSSDSAASISSSTTPGAWRETGDRFAAVEWQAVHRRQSDRDLPLFENRAALHEAARRRRHRQRRLDHGSVGRALSERVVPGREGRRGESDAGTCARMGGRRHSRERGGADLRRH